MKYTLTIFLITVVMNVNLAHAQTNNEFRAEEFLVEVFYGYMTEKSPKVYLEKQTYLPTLLYDYKVPNSNNPEDVFETTTDEGFFEAFNQTWNKNAPLLQQPKYKNLIFVDDISKLSKKERKKVEQRKFTKPIFSKNGQFALIETNRVTVHKYSWKYRWAHFPNRDFWKAKYQIDTSYYRDLYQRIDGKWIEIKSENKGHSF